MSWGAVAVGAGTAVSYIGGQQAASAAGRAAGATTAEAKRQSQRAEAFGTNLMGQVKDLSGASPEELAAYSRSLDAASNMVMQNSKLLEAVNPALMEASTQALQLLRGNDAQSLAPIRAQRDSQRGQLLRTLREQLGPGAETTSAGQKALQQFDMETSSLLNQAQQGTLQMLLGSTQNSKSQISSDIGVLQNVGIGYGNISNRQAQAVLGAGTATLNGITLTGGAVTQNAGSPFVSSMLQGQGLQALGGQVANAGASMGLFGGRNSSGNSGFSGGSSAPGFSYSSPTFGNIGGGP